MKTDCNAGIPAYSPAWKGHDAHWANPAVSYKEKTFAWAKNMSNDLGEINLNHISCFIERRINSWLPHFIEDHLGYSYLLLLFLWYGGFWGAETAAVNTCKYIILQSAHK